MPSFTTPNSDGEDYTRITEVWSDSSRASAARARRGAGAPILAKPLGRGRQRGDRSVGQRSYATPRKTSSMHYPEARTRLDKKYLKHDVVNPDTGEVSNAKFSSHFKRFMRKVKKSAWKATKAIGRKRPAKFFYSD